MATAETYDERRAAFLAGLIELTRRTRISIYGGSFCGDEMMLTADHGDATDDEMSKSYYKDGGDDSGLEFLYPGCTDYIEPPAITPDASAALPPPSS